MGMTELLQVGLSSWIISDGNYKDFSVGDVRSFALEYYNEDKLRPATEPSFRRYLGDARYAVAGSRLHLGGLSQHLTPTWCVIDVGVLAYRELHQFDVPPDRFSGEVYLGVDHFSYFERLAHEADAPPLIYNWRVHRIEVETAPRILKDGMWIYDPDKRGCADVQETKGGEDFILHCERLPDLPQKRLVHT
jgi:hypothetical protein